MAMIFAPHLVCHVDLKEKFSFSIPQVEGIGYYLVFWVDNIPLGHLYLRKNDQIGNTELVHQIVQSINPSIFYYSKKRVDVLDVNFHDLVLRNVNNLFPEQPEDYKALDISVVVCTRNRSTQLKRCLDSLLQQRVLPSEIIIVDNAPTDDATEVLAKKYDCVVYVKEPRLGLDIARNTGARVAKSSIVAYTDDDVIFHPLWVFNVWQSFQNPKIKAMTGLIIAASLETQSQQIFEQFWSFNRGYVDKIYNADFFNDTLEEGPPVWEIGAGANMAFRKEVFDSVGYFDERLDVGAAGCNGDSEMWYRILAAGYEIHYNPRAVCYHEHRREMRGLQKQLFFYMRGFTAAALIQQQANRNARYKLLLFKKFPAYYLRLFVRGFLKKDLRHKTLWSEIRGIISGVRFYLQNKNLPSQRSL